MLVKLYPRDRKCSVVSTRSLTVPAIVLIRTICWLPNFPISSKPPRILKPKNSRPRLACALSRNPTMCIFCSQAALMSSMMRMIVGVAAPIMISCSTTRGPQFFQREKIVRGPLQKIVARTQVELGVQSFPDAALHRFQIEEPTGAFCQQSGQFPAQADTTFEVG